MAAALLDWAVATWHESREFFDLTPPPLTPWFKDGGVFDGLNEDATLTVFIVIFLFVVDFGLIKHIVHPKGRWFALHAVANAICAVAAFPDVVKVFVDPVHAMQGPSASMIANAAVVAAHAYHALVFNLTPSEIFHHIVFVSILCGLAIPGKQVGGAANNFGAFFLSGLPGGTIYCLLVCVKQGWMDKGTEKLWSSRINTWLRGPSMTVYTFVMYQAWLLGQIRGVPTWAACTAAALHFFNGQYYAEMANGTYHRYITLKQLEKSSRKPKTQ
eukprot:m.487525 g.487525  ORF g.487525 m.487525 type:complete len:272 (-) comp25063_c0_seq1:24-839(-)